MRSALRLLPLLAVVASGTGCATLLSASQRNPDHRGRTGELITFAAGGVGDLFSGVFTGAFGSLTNKESDSTTYAKVCTLIGSLVSGGLDVLLWRVTDQERHYRRK